MNIQQARGKPQTKNFRRLSSAVCTVERKYLRWKVGDILFLCDLFKDQKKRIKKPDAIFAVCRLS